MPVNATGCGPRVFPIGLVVGVSGAAGTSDSGPLAYGLSRLTLVRAIRHAMMPKASVGARDGCGPSWTSARAAAKAVEPGVGAFNDPAPRVPVGVARLFLDLRRASGYAGCSRARGRAPTSPGCRSRRRGRGSGESARARDRDRLERLAQELLVVAVGARSVHVPIKAKETCPDCRADVPDEARVCRHCGYEFWSDEGGPIHTASCSS